MAWPEEHADTVLYVEKEIIADKDLALRMIDGSRFDFWGTIFVNGQPFFVDHVFDVTNYGAKGDGSTDDKLAIQTALDAAAITGGTVYFPPGRSYMTTGGHIYTLANTTDSNPLCIMAYGATIKLKSGSNQILLQVERNNMNALIPPPFIKGGRWIDVSNGTGNACFLFRDIGPRMEDVTIRDFKQGKGIILQNWYGWSEQSRILNCGVSGTRHALYFSDGADSGGPGGTGMTSFARTQVTNFSMSNGEAGYGLIRTTGNVYHSSFIGLWGNLSNIACHIIQDEGATGSFGGTKVWWSGFEGMAPGTFFYYRPDNIWPTNKPDIYSFDQIGTNMTLTNLTDPAGNLTTSFHNKVMVSGYKYGHLGTEWAIGIGGGKSIVADRHPSGPNPTGTRMNWMEINTNDELVIGGTNSLRSPVATMLGRFAPVKICAPGQQLGFFDVGPIARPTVAGSRGGNAALASLITALAQYGLIIDSSTV